MAGKYDPTDSRHVSALAVALGLGPLTWSVRRDPANQYTKLLVCRRSDGREYTMHTMVGGSFEEQLRQQRDLDRFVVDISDALLADVVAGIP